MVTQIFWNIIGLGLAIPSTIVLIFNLSVKARAGDNYQIDVSKTFLLYTLCLLGWAIFFGVVV